MKVILLKELPGRGGEGDVIEVARGFATNYLIPQEFAILATKGNLKQLEQRRHNIAKREEVRIAHAEERRAKLEGMKVTIRAKVGDEGQLFGSVTTQMIANALKEDKEIEVDRRRIEVHKPIRTTGEHEVAISLYRDIRAVVVLNVVDEAEVVEADEEAAEAQEANEPAPESGDQPVESEPQTAAAEEQPGTATKKVEEPVA